MTPLPLPDAGHSVRAQLEEIAATVRALVPRANIWIASAMLYARDRAGNTVRAWAVTGQPCGIVMDLNDGPEQWSRTWHAIGRLVLWLEQGRWL
jgi:hypothetical protein